MVVGIQYLTYQQIDKHKWDQCIDQASNGLIYAYTYYLDGMSANWNALVLNDYEAVMPLTWKRKWGISYLYQPPFIQQLGIYSKNVVTTEIIDNFLIATKKQFSFAEFFVNFKKGEVQPNYILPLYQPYEMIRKNYKNDLLKNLRHAAKFSLSYQLDEDISTAIELYKSHYAIRTPHVTERHYAQFKNVCITAKEKGYLLIRKVINQKGILLAITLMLKDEHRLYNILSTVTNDGRQCEANHFLFDQLVKEFSGKQLVMDFEGSAIPGVARFYQNFGAINEPYYFLRYNNLPGLLKYLKPRF